MRVKGGICEGNVRDHVRDEKCKIPLFKGLRRFHVRDKGFFGEYSAIFLQQEPLRLRKESSNFLTKVLHFGNRVKTGFLRLYYEKIVPCL